jgi:hypothetical protein
MPDPKPSKYVSLNYRQEARAEALYVAKDILSASMLFGKGAPPAERQIQDLLNLAEYVIGDGEDVPTLATDVSRWPGWSIPLPSDAIPGIFSALGDALPDCNHPECPIHAPRREAKDLDPEDAKSSFDRSDATNAQREKEHNTIHNGPPDNPAAVVPGTVFVFEGRRWESRRGPLGDRAFWYNLGEAN